MHVWVLIARLGVKNTTSLRTNWVLKCTASVHVWVIKLIFDDKICIYYIVLLDYYTYVVLLYEQKVIFR